MNYHNRIHSDLENTHNISEKIFKDQIYLNPPKSTDDFFNILQERKSKRLETRIMKHFNLPQLIDCPHLVENIGGDDGTNTLRDIIPVFAPISTNTEIDKGIKIELSTRGFFFPVWEKLKYNSHTSIDATTHFVGFTKNGSWVHITAKHISYKYEERVQIGERARTNDKNYIAPFIKSLSFYVEKINNGSELFSLLNEHHNQDLAETSAFILRHMRSELTSQTSKLENRLRLANEFLEDNEIKYHLLYQL